MPEEVRIKFNKEQTLKFLSFFVDDAIRIANERKRKRLATTNDQQKNISQGGEINANYQC